MTKLNIFQNTGKLFIAFLLSLVLSLLAVQTHAQEFELAESSAVKARLISAETGVAPHASTVSLGVDIVLEEDWKTYWRSPGEVGLPPEFNWDGSQNVADIELQWPAPKRFTAFGIENFGYEKRVVFPIRATLNHPGKPASFTVRMTLLVCANVCIPQDFVLHLALDATTGVNIESAALIASHLQRVPKQSQDSDTKAVFVALDAQYLTVFAQSDRPFASPDIFPELGSEFSFGKPKIQFDATRTKLWARLPILRGVTGADTVVMTITDGDRAVTSEVTISTQAPSAPFEPNAKTPFSELALIVALAFIGGLVLNAMPCVLPVLTIKIASVLSHQGRQAASVHTGFLVSFLGIMAFMWALSGLVIIFKAAAMTVGWGIQFQNPVFVLCLFLILVLFAASLLGLFDFNVPQWVRGRAVSTERGYAGDFATGALAALLATPCSAPFLGTGVAVALTGGPLETVLIFTAIGIGLGLPYLVFAARPRWITNLPKPGPWMVRLKFWIGMLVLLTALWVLWVLSSLSTHLVAAIATAAAIGLVAIMTRPPRRRWLAPSGFTGLSILAIYAAAVVAPTSTLSATPSNWVNFDRRQISKLVSEGQTVLVDVTADWCLTCKANKTLVLNRNPISSLLATNAVVAMQADWTRANADISRYLRAYNRYGIPLNVVYGPNAPGGIVLPEILTTSAVLGAIKAARNTP